MDTDKDTTAKAASDLPVVPAEPRGDVRARFRDGRVFSAPVNTPLTYFAQAAAGADRPQTVAMLVNGRLRELVYTLKEDVRVVPVDMSTADGARIYRRSLVFLLVTAASELFPDTRILIEHASFNGGYFGRVIAHEPFTADELAQLEAHMHKIVAADDPIVRDELSLDEAIALFERQGDIDKLRLLRHRTSKPSLVVYTLRDHYDYMYGYQVPSTGYLRWFALEAADNDRFLLKFPRRHTPNTLQPTQSNSQLLTMFREYGTWLRKLGISNVGALNDAILSGRVAELSLVIEALHEQRIAHISHKIVTAPGPLRVVLIAGPSCSGKTTFSKRLAIQMLTRGVRPFTLPTDDFFLNREATPRDENGEYDFESLNAVDVARLNHDLKALINGEQVTLPHFNFKTGQREVGETVQLGSDHVILLEGIHSLNPALIPQIPLDRVFKVYVSCMTALNLDNYNRVSTTDTRLIRRIVRDAQFRGYSARATLSRWESVRRGEKRHILPFSDNADYFFNSALAHELSVMRRMAERLLLQVRPSQEEYVEAKRLRVLLQWFRPAPSNIVPDNSLLREFIGGSILDGFRVWSEPHTID